MKKTAELIDAVATLATSFDENFLEMASYLRRLQDEDPEEFKHAIQKAKLGSRKAYYLSNLDRVYSKIPVPKARLKKIGWTKLMLLTSHIGKENYGPLLKQAETLTAKQLEQFLKGEEPQTKQRAVLAYFTPEDYADLERAMVMFDGKRSGRGIVNKEEALVKLARYALSQKEATAKPN